MNRRRSLLTLTLCFALAACGGDEAPDMPGPGTSHLGGTATAHGSCDNPSDSPGTCYAYVGSLWAGQSAPEGCADLKGTYSATQGCSSAGRGGRCALFEDSASAYVAHCYQSTAECERLCKDVGTFTAN